MRVYGPAKKYRRPSEWLKSFESNSKDSIHYFARVYGSGNAIIPKKSNLLISMLKEYIQNFDDGPVLISRAPGRVNIMGRHIDHQGGHGNMMAIHQDVYLIVGPREEDRHVYLCNMESEKFSSQKFSIDDLVCDYQGEKWLEFINRDSVRKSVLSAQGDWSNYIKAAIARFQTGYSDRPFKGMNIIAAVDIPIAAGLSSSSALVVASAEAIVNINDVKITPQHFVNFCGEGEWYVGTRGGSADHAAMKFSKKGNIVQIGFFPLRVSETVPFPDNHFLVVCNSCKKAYKTGSAINIYNHRVACYNIGREMLKQRFPKHASVIEHLRDFNPRKLSVQYSELLEMLKEIPVSLSREELRVNIGAEKAEEYLKTHSPSINLYPIRPVVIFGLAECERSRNCMNLLRNFAVAEFGHWMNVSHDGDRVVKFDRQGNSRPFAMDYTDTAIDELIVKAKTDHNASSLAFLPGAYGCSIPQIDRMIDIVLSIQGVKGAQLAGAGLGGCMVTLIHKDAYEDLEKSIIREYYQPASIEPEIFTFFPVAGSGLVSF